jgi:hypothetical protein
MRRFHLICFALVMSQALTADATFLYGIAGNDKLYSIALGTGHATLLTTTAGIPENGIALLNGTLYTTDFLPPGSIFEFGILNPSNGQFTEVSNQGGSANWDGLATNVSAGLMYTVDNNHNGVLTEVKPNGTTTTVGSGVGLTTMVSTAYDNLDGILYGLGINRGLYRISTITGLSALVGATGITDVGYGAGIAYDDSDRKLFLNDEVVSTGVSSLYTVNTTTGLASLVGLNDSANSSHITAIAFVPEPSASLICAVGLIYGLSRRSR